MKLSIHHNTYKVKVLMNNCINYIRGQQQLTIVLSIILRQNITTS